VGISVLIASTLRNARVAPASISIRKALSEAATCQVITKDATGAFIPAVGNILEIQDQASVTQFFGSIQDVESAKIENRVGIQCSISATDLNHATSRRLAGEYSWAEKTVLQIVTDIVTDSLSGDLTDITLVQTGPTIANFAVSYPTVREAFDALAEMAGMRWFIDELNKLRFFTPAGATAPFSITDTTNVSALSIRETREDYSNSAVGRVGSGLVDPVTENFIGDGVKTSFELVLPVGQVPGIQLDTVVQTVGIGGVDTGKDWYWNENSNEIRQDSGGVVLIAANTLAVTYVGIEQFYVSSVNAAEVTARALVENNSGNYQKFIEVDGLKTRGDAQASVAAYVARQSSMTHALGFETNDFLEPAILGLRPGDVLSMTAPGFGTTGSFLVQAIVLTHMEGVTDQATYQWRARVDAVKGPVLRGFLDLLSTGGGSGSTSGAGAVSIGGAGSFVYEVVLTANTTITPPVASTPGGRITIYVTQGAGPYTISFSTEFKQVVNTNISATNGDVSVFDFTGRADGLWWPSSFSMTGLA